MQRLLPTCPAGNKVVLSSWRTCVGTQQRRLLAIPGDTGLYGNSSLSTARQLLQAGDGGFTEVNITDCLPGGDDLEAVVAALDEAAGVSVSTTIA